METALSSRRRERGRPAAALPRNSESEGRLGLNPLRGSQSEPHHTPPPPGPLVSRERPNLGRNRTGWLETQQEGQVPLECPGVLCHPGGAPRQTRPSSESRGLPGWPLLAAVPDRPIQQSPSWVWVCEPVGSVNGDSSGNPINRFHVRIGVQWPVPSCLLFCFFFPASPAAPRKKRSGSTHTQPPAPHHGPPRPPPPCPSRFGHATLQQPPDLLGS